MPASERSLGERDAVVLLEQRTGSSIGYEVAVALLGAGDREGALAHLEAARIDRSERMVDLKIDPRMRPLFGDPVFERIAGEVGLGA